MRETDIYTYFRFGYNYYYLQNDSEGIAFHGPDSNSLIVLIDEFLATLKELDLQVTQNVAVDLRNIRLKINSLPKDAKVDKVLANEVEEATQKLDATLDAELQLRSAFIVTPKRLQLDHLLRVPQSLFGPALFESLPAISQFDFREAGRCVAFGLATAAAFHIMRGTEGVLRHYYCTIVKRDRLRVLLWGPMVDHLRKRRNPPPKGLTDNLDNIRANFRNPTQHPDSRYDMEEAQDLFSLSIDAINRMVRDLSKRGA
jgi:hypothetical protein